MYTVKKFYLGDKFTLDTGKAGQWTGTGMGQWGVMNSKGQLTTGDNPLGGKN